MPASINAGAIFSQSQDVFQILENGFGAGAHFFSLCAAWQAGGQSGGQSGARLHYLAIEPQPLSRAALKAALAGKDLPACAAQLLAQWPPLIPGFHSLSLSPRLTLTLVFGDLGSCLPQITGEFDAVISDVPLPTGALVLRRRISAPPRALVIGAGIAGASAAYAMARRGIAVNVIERIQPASGGSGNPVAVVRAEPGGAHHPITTLSAAGVTWLMRWIAQYGQTVPHDFCGAIRLTRDAPRHEKLAAHAREFPPEWLHEIDRDSASRLAGQRVAERGFLLPYAGWLEPVALVEALLAHPLITLQSATGVEDLQQAPDGQWRLSLSDGSSMVSGCVILASAFASALSPVPLAIDRARGQLSMVPQRPGQTLDKVVCRDGYLTPAVRGWHTIGATIQKNDACADARQADDLENFQRVQRLLPGFVEDPALLSSGRVAWRAVTQDRLPMVGRVADGVYASLAHGSRGITCAPLCGEWLAALILGECLPLAASWQRLLDPLRMASSEASSGAS